MLSRLRKVINIVPPVGTSERDGLVEWIVICGLSKRPASSAALSARRLSSSTSASEATESSSPSKTIGSSMSY